MPLAIAVLYTSTLAAAVPATVFMEPVGEVKTDVAEISGIKTFRVVDGAKYRPWLENESARRALALYATAYELVSARGNPQKQPAAYYIALVKGGNHAATGFKLQTEAGVEDHAQHAYILLDADPERFETTILHETGHVAMSMLNGGRELPRADVCSIPHSTAALTDRGTAFSEGWAIHLETLEAHLAQSPELRRRYHRGTALVGEGPYREVEFFRPASDLATYSQNLARYTEVRENAFAFQSAFKQGDYLRAQLEKARDYASLRDANQLLQSEGYYAAFFFLFAIRGAETPSEDVVAARERKMLDALQRMFARVKPKEDTPWLIEFVQSYMEAYPAEKNEIAAALQDTSRGVFVDAGAPAAWRRHYMAALRLDLKSLNAADMLNMRQGWIQQTIENPAVLRSRVGPQVGCTVKDATVSLVAFGEPQPLLFDLNTAEEGVLRAVPGLSDNALSRWMDERAKRPFASLADFHERVPGGPRCN